MRPSSSSLRGAKVATDAHRRVGELSLPRPEPPGTYSITIRAPGYQTTGLRRTCWCRRRQPEVSFQTAINRQPQGLRQIASVATSRTASLQTSSTINTHVDTSVMQSENYQRLGDVLTTVPGVITSTSSSVGDDMSLSIRGFDSTETATLLDGHPIGPVGAFGGGYNYNVSPFWGFRGVDVVFGSGATGSVRRDDHRRRRQLPNHQSDARVPLLGDPGRRQPRQADDGPARNRDASESSATRSPGACRERPETSPAG